MRIDNEKRIAQIPLERRHSAEGKLFGKKYKKMAHLYPQKNFYEITIPLIHTGDVQPVMKFKGDTHKKIMKTFLNKYKYQRNIAALKLAVPDSKS